MEEGEGVGGGGWGVGKRGGGYPGVPPPTVYNPGVYEAARTSPQNDQGSSQASGNAHHFLTYLKARIYCETKVPPLTAFDGALNYQYNNISK